MRDFQHLDQQIRVSNPNPRVSSLRFINGLEAENHNHMEAPNKGVGDKEIRNREIIHVAQDGDTLEEP